MTSAQRDVFIQLLLMVNKWPAQWEWQGELYTVREGQCITSLEKIKERCAPDVTIKQIRTSIKKLEKWGFLTNVGTKTGRLITIIKYRDYQEFNTDMGKETGSQRAAKAQLTIKKKKEKKRYTLSIMESDFTPQNEQEEEQIQILCDEVNKEYQSLLKMEAPLTLEQMVKLIKEYGKDKVFSIFSAMENYPRLTVKYNSAYLTAKNWLNKSR
jgi:uncharacterized protein YaaR (DUF327 family)